MRTQNGPRCPPLLRRTTDGIDVVWTATSTERGRVVVGWYRNATVFRHLQRCDHGVYQIKARTTDCRLLPVSKRTINIETRRSGRPGNSPVWYAETPYGANLRRRVLRQMHEAEHQIFDRDDLEIHHVDRLADGGADVPDNAVALCPNCHREAHYGDRADAIRQELLDRVASRRQN